MSELWAPPDDPIVPEVRSACERLRLAERYRSLDRAPAFPWREFRALGRAGLLGLTLPRRLGGRGLPASRAAVALLHLAYHGGTTFAKLAMQPEFCSVLASRGSAELRRRWLGPLLAGRRLIANHLTEPTAGSDVLGLRLTAEPRKDGYRLTGTKSELAFAVDADAAIAYGRLPGTEGAAGVTAFLVPQTLGGIRRSLEPPDMGERWMRRGTVVYDRVDIPAGFRLGREGEGFAYMRDELVRDRGLLAAIYLGAAWASWDETIRFAAERTTFGRPLLDRQEVGFRLVDDATALVSTWLFTREALSRYEEGEDAAAATAMAKVRSTEVALQTVDHCIQFHGGRGYSARWPHEQRWRDIRSGPIAHGPSEVLRGIAARRLGRGRVRARGD